MGGLVRQSRSSPSTLGSPIYPDSQPVSPLHGVGWRESAVAHQVSTAEDNGILLYNGDNDHIAVELYQGHVRVSYDPGSYPSSAIYRYGFLVPIAAAESSPSTMDLSTFWSNPGLEQQPLLPLSHPRLTGGS